MIVAATDNHLFPILDWQRYLTVTADLQIATLQRETQANRAIAINHQGRADKVCGNIGTSVIASNEGDTMGPPADSE